MKLRAKITEEKCHENAFLVCLVKTPALPGSMTRADFFNELAVVAVNDEGGNGKYGGVHLTSDEKNCIGEELSAWDVPVGKWMWCELYENQPQNVIDRKFRFVAVNPCNQKTYTEENAIVFCAKDKALIPALRSYAGACVALDCGPEHIESIDLLIERVKAYQDNIESHAPDTHLQCEIDRCIGGKV